jgi:CheY-like chemotaxis protein
MKILIIEDDKLTLLSLKQMVLNLGHSVSTAGNAEEALREIGDHNFDLIFSDIMMPGISGLSLLTILRTVHLCKTPIIAMSVLDDKPLLQATFDAGANDFMVKPITSESIKQKIEKFEKGISPEKNIA